MRIRHRTQRRDQHRPARAFRPAQDRLVKLDRVLVMIQLRLEPALQITLLLFVAERRRTRFVENAAGAGVIAFIEEQLARTQLSAVVPNRIAQEEREGLESFIETLQSPERFGLAE